jgi:hypothetical protein
MDDGCRCVPLVLGDRLSQMTEVPIVDAAPSEASATASTAADTMEGMLRPQLMVDDLGSYPSHLRFLEKIEDMDGRYTFPPSDPPQCHQWVPTQWNECCLLKSLVESRGVSPLAASLAKILMVCPRSGQDAFDMPFEGLTCSRYGGHLGFANVPLTSCRV